MSFKLVEIKWEAQGPVLTNNLRYFISHFYNFLIDFLALRKTKKVIMVDDYNVYKVLD